MAELVDALVLGTSANGVGVRVPSSAPITNLFQINRIDEYENQSEMVDFFITPRGGKSMLNVKIVKIVQKAINNHFCVLVPLPVRTGEVPDFYA